MNNQSQEIKARLNIVDIVGDYVPLKKSGSTHWGLCPFHSEKTPSFSVSTDKQTFHCFGCGKGGDVFTFLMEIEGLSFTEALKQLAQRAGVELKYDGQHHKKNIQKDVAKSIMEEALLFFKLSLASESAQLPKSYLEARQVRAQECAEFELGWAPASWNALSHHLTSKGFSENAQVSAGLIAFSEKGSYDRFRGRIIFPIRDDREKLVGFGGRIIDGDGAKYLNSPESEYFNKRRLLYLLGKAKRHVREKKRLILVEGYMDALRAHQHDFKETVASLGTSLTQEQVALIKRFSDLAYICYDSDSAGQEAALRGMYLLQRAGIEVRVVSLPSGKDPDDILLKEGASSFEEALKQAHPLPRFHALVRKPMLADPAQRTKARDDLLTGLASLPTLDVAPHLPAISQLFGVLPHELQKEITAYREKHKLSKGGGAEELVPDYFDEESIPSTSDDLECALCSRLWGDASLCSTLTVHEILPLLNDPSVSAVVLALLMGEQKEELAERWRQLGDRESLQRIAKGDAFIERDGLGEMDVKEIVDLLTRRKIKKLYTQAKQRVIMGNATDEDIRSYEEYARQLKSGGGSR